MKTSNTSLQSLAHVDRMAAELEVERRQGGGERLKTLRAEISSRLGSTFTQRALADLLSINRSMISQIEGGWSHITENVARKVEAALCDDPRFDGLRYSVSYLLYGEESGSDYPITESVVDF